MAPIPNRAPRLFVHLGGDGQVWSAPRGGLPAATGQDAAAWVRDHDVPSSGAYYLLGSPGNAPLIVALAEARPEAQVHLHAPAVCPTARLRTDPAAVLRRLQVPELHDCRPGRRHRLAAADLAAYRLIAGAGAGASASPNAVRLLLEAHPAFPAVAYLAGRSFGLPETERHAAALLRAIVDPRWFVHPGRPGRRGPLHRHLGLEPATLRGFFEAAPAGRHFPMAFAAVSLWNNASTQADLAAYGTARPEAFLWRIAAAHRPAWKGALRATERAVDLVVRVWLERVAPGREGAHFEPARFFRTDEEAVAYTNHCKRLAACAAAAG